MFKIKIIADDPMLPVKEHEGDAGFDVFNHGGDIKLWPGERVSIKLGFALEIPEGFVCLIQEKSGMALKQGIFTIGNVIDSGYRGEVHAILTNTSNTVITIPDRTKVAQMLIMPCYTGTSYVITSDLSDTTRGEGSVGSTGLWRKKNG